MKLLDNKLVLATALTAALGLASTNAAAFEQFTIDESSLEGNVNTVTADRITGGYTEVVTFTAADATSGTFDTSIIFNAGQYFLGNTSQPKLLGNLGATGYEMYATFLGSGTYQINADGSTDFLFDAVGGFDLFADLDSDTTFGEPVNGSTAWTLGLNGDDILLGSGNLLFGSGTLDPNSPTCVDSGGVNCGSFGTNTDFALTAAGMSFFVDPDPFYDLTFESGQFLTFVVSGTQTIGGSMDVVFDRVPEPSSLALLGAGLIGFGLSRRKAKA